MDPAAAITGINISFMGWDGPQNKLQETVTVPEESFCALDYNRDYTLKRFKVKGLVHPKIKIQSSLVCLHTILPQHHMTLF